MGRIKHLQQKFSVAWYETIVSCTGDELRFYLYLKLYAINNHSAWPGSDTLANDLGMSKRTIVRLIKMMEDKGRLKVDRSNGKLNIYDITWYDEAGEKSSAKMALVGKADQCQNGTRTSAKNGKAPVPKMVTPSYGTKISERIENNDSAEAPAQWTFKGALGRMMSDKRTEIRIVALYYFSKGFTYESSAQLATAIRRDVRPAIKLKTYSEARISKVMGWLKDNADFKWTLESVHKHIDEDLAAIGRAPQVVRI